MMYDRPYESFVRLFLACEPGMRQKVPKAQSGREVRGAPDADNSCICIHRRDDRQGAQQDLSSKLLIWRSGEASQGAQIRGGFSDNHTQSPNRRKRQMIRDPGSGDEGGGVF
ncbi:unnamed protein product [Spirodela intermedia]|uniref:Uncharacterized protein n=1 Tax=Spirodela intermedia TaxID=51605 RepID=A0ABN7ED02_SPIIN|nr:unnamed protein product [Spirodela intermedia]